MWLVIFFAGALVFVSVVTSSCDTTCIDNQVAGRRLCNGGMFYATFFRMIRRCRQGFLRVMLVLRFLLVGRVLFSNSKWCWMLIDKSWLDFTFSVILNIFFRMLLCFCFLPEIILSNTKPNISVSIVFNNEKDKHFYEGAIKIILNIILKRYPLWFNLKIKQSNLVHSKNYHKQRTWCSSHDYTIVGITSIEQVKNKTIQ